MLPLSSGPEVARPRYRQDRRRLRQTTDLGIRAIAVQPALGADGDDDDHAADHATAVRALRTTTGHAHRKAATGRESLARVVVLALAFVVVFVLALASVLVPALGDTTDVRAAVWWRSAGHRRSRGRGDLRTDRGEPHHAQEGRRLL